MTYGWKVLLPLDSEVGNGVPMYGKTHWTAGVRMEVIRIHGYQDSICGAPVRICRTRPVTWILVLIAALKNIHLGYSLPGAIINKVGLEKVRIYFSGDNLLTFSGINENFDPEAPWGGAFPHLSQFPLVLTLLSKTLKIQKDEKVNL